MKGKFNNIIMGMFLVMTLTFSSGNNMERMTVIENGRISTLNIDHSEDVSNVTKSEKHGDKINKSEDINVQIARHILKYEGKVLVNNSTEYSKYGITDHAMKRYNSKYKTSYSVDKISENDAITIVVNLMKEYRMMEIKDPRIRVVVFDTMFNTGNVRAGKITQRAINFYNNIKHKERVAVDGIVGSGTIRNLNEIDDVDLFIKLFIYERINSYKQFKEWDKYGNGWTIRILSVGDFKA